MNSNSNQPHDLYRQNTDLQIIGVLFPRLKNPTFLDVGAEKGGFSTALFRMGFEKGVLCEPLPSHLKHLDGLFASSAAKILPYAIDRVDRTATFNIACDESGTPLDYFHSLNKIANHTFFQHSRSIETQCRSLESLLASGEIFGNIGVLKIDTEGNDLRVLEGIGSLRPEVVMCEFVPPSVYPDWRLSFAANLIPEGRKLGYTHQLAIQRTHGSAVECVRLEPETFTANDWGNLVFIRQDLFEAAGADLRAWILSHEDRFHGSARIPVVHHPGYGIAFRKWLGAQLAGFSRGPERSVALDVGAHEGAFTRACLETVLVSKAIVFEPHPGNAERLRQSFAGAPVTVEEMAVAACGGTGNFLYGDDTATGSLLAAIGAEKNAVRSRTVPITSLDGYAAAHGLLEKVALLKIDTQATDLRVLEGAESLLRESQPIVVVEMIFAPLYENQDDPADLMLWLTRRGYRLAGFFDEHFSREGWLAWCDACFLPVGRMPGYQPPFTIRESCPEEAVAETGVACEAAARKRRGLGGLLHRLFTNHS